MSGLEALGPYWVDDDHVWRFDVDNPGPNDDPRPVGFLHDGWMLVDAIDVALSDLAHAEANRMRCACDYCSSSAGAV